MSSTMNNFLHMRNSKKAYAVYAVGIFVVFSIGLVIKNFNDKIGLMTESVHSYQKMIDKQTDQMKAMSMEKERYKRDLKEEKEVNAETIREMEVKVTKLEEECKQENAKLEAEMSDLQDIHNNLEEQNKKLENKYKTLSKANSAAIADIENLKAENKNLRTDLHDSSTSKASELMQLRDSMARLSTGRWSVSIFCNCLTPLLRAWQVQRAVLSLVQAAPAVTWLNPTASEWEGPAAGADQRNTETEWADRSK